MDQQGKNYTGKINKTRYGQNCQAWSSLVPHEHPFAVKLVDDENYCRNPDTELYGPWCYTTDRTRWEYCDVPYCGVYSINILLILYYFQIIISGVSSVQELIK